MRGSKAGGIGLGLVGLWALVLGAFWFWAGLSIFVCSVSADCETIDLHAFGAFFGRQGGTCLALEDRSSWGIPGGLAALIVVVAGGAILAGSLWLFLKAAELWNASV